MDLSQLTSLYTPLGDSDIRLVKFGNIPLDVEQNGMDFSQIELQLEHFHTDKAPTYLALSYVWGDNNNTRSININGRPFDVTENLYQALLHIRRLAPRFEKGLGEIYATEKVELFLWIDAISINQNDVDERSKQVPRMTDIYRSAYNVLIWLGITVTFEGGIKSPNFQDFLAAVRACTSFTDFQKFQSVASSWEEFRESCPSQNGADLLGPYYEILRMEWFKRVWILQECALSRHEPFVLLGEELFPFGPLYTIGEEILKAAGKDAGKDAEPPGEWWDLVIGALQIIIRRSFGKQYLRDWITSKHFQNASWADHILGIMTNFWAKSCSDPRDQVYGLLGMINISQLPEYLLPDYQKPYELVCKSYTKSIIENTGDLRLLQFAIGCKAFAGQPSWVMDFRYQPAGRHGAPIQQANFPLFDGDELVLEGKPAGRVLQYFCGGGDEPELLMRVFYTTVLTKAAEIRQVPLAEIWAEWLSCHLLSFFKCPGIYKNLSYPKIAELLDPTCSRNQSKDEGFDSRMRDVVKHLFSYFFSILLDNGHVSSYTRHQGSFEHTGDHDVFAFRGSTKLCIVQQEQPGEYRYLGWLQEGSVDDILDSNLPLERIALV